MVDRNDYNKLLDDISRLKKINKKDQTQDDRVLYMLYYYFMMGQNLPLIKILTLKRPIASHTKCISDLRLRGYDIKCHSYNVGKKRHTEYELIV